MVHRTDRLLKVKTEFSRIGILDKVVFFNGIYHKDGAVGCIKSHLSIIKEAKNDNLKNVLVFEDDVVFEQTDLSLIDISCAELPFDWELLYLGANLHSDIHKYSEHLLSLNNAYSTHAIAYNANIFSDIIAKYDGVDSCKNTNDILDVWLTGNIQNRKKSFLTIPLHAIQSNDYSDILKQTVDYSFIKERYKKFARI